MRNIKLKTSGGNDMNQCKVCEVVIDDDVDLCVDCENIKYHDEG